MIKGRFDNDIILGIDAENVKRLKEDKPIKVKGKELGIDVDIYIIYGDTLSDVMQKLTGEKS